MKISSISITLSGSLLAVALFSGIVVGPATAGTLEEHVRDAAISEYRAASLSSASSNTFVRSDGTRRVEAFSTRVNFRSPQGTWDPISNDLVDSPGAAYELENESNDYTVRLPSDPATTPLRFETDGAWIKMRLRGAGDELTQTGDDTAAFDYATSQVSIQAEGWGAKETIALGSPPTSKVLYVYDLQSSAGLVPTLVADGSIEFRDDSGDVKIVIPKGIMSDSSGTPAVSDEVAYDLSRSPAGWSLSVTPSVSWLQDPSRVYPVRVDRSVSTVRMANSACTVLESAPAASYCGGTYSYMTVGQTSASARYRGLVDFDISTIPSNATVTAADVVMFMNPNYTSGALQSTGYAFFLADRAWNASATWNSSGAAGPWQGGNPGTFAYGAKSFIGNETPGYKIFNGFGNLVSNWITGSSHRGLIFKQSGTPQNQVIAFYTNGDANDGKKPYMSIEYTPYSPAVPNALAVSNCVSACTSTSPVINSTVPLLGAKSSSTSGAQLQFNFSVRSLGTSDIVAASGWTTNQPQSQRAEWRVPAGKLANAGSYTFQVQAREGTYTSDASPPYTFRETGCNPDTDTDDCGVDPGCDPDALSGCTDYDSRPRPDNIPPVVWKYAPLARFDTDEEFFPANASNFINNSRLRWHTDYCSDPEDYDFADHAGIHEDWLSRDFQSFYSHNEDVLQPGSQTRCQQTGSNFDPADNVAPLNKGGVKGHAGLYLDLDNNRDDLHTGFGLNDSDPVYYRYVPGKRITYWFFYMYDSHLGVPHEGDWEHVTLRLTPQNEPDLWFFFYHHRQCYEYPNIIRRYQGRPYIWIAQEDHASYTAHAYTDPAGQGDFPDGGGAKWNTRNNLQDLRKQSWFRNQLNSDPTGPYAGGWGEVHGKNSTGPSGPNPFKVGAATDFEHSHECSRPDGHVG